MKKYEKIFQELEAQIRSGELDAGRKLLTEHQICESYGVSRITASRALNELLKAGLVERRPGLGTFVKAPSGMPSGLFFMILLTMGHSNCREVMSSFDDELLQNGRIGAFLSAGFRNSHLAELIRNIETFGTAGACIHPSPYREDHEAAIKVINETRLPIITYYRQLNGFTGPQMVIDEMQCGEMAAEHLIGLGHKKLAYIGVSQPVENVSNNTRYQGFVEGCAKHGVDPERYPVLHFHDPFKLQSLKQIFSSSDRPTALVAASEYHAVLGCEAIASFGLKIPEDVALVTLDGGTVSAAADIPLTAVDFPMIEIGIASARTLLDINSGKIDVTTPLIKKFPGKLVVRDSCGASKSFRHEYLANQLSKDIT